MVNNYRKILESGDSLDLFPLMEISTTDSVSIETASGDTTVPAFVQITTIQHPNIMIGPTPYLISASDVVFSSGICTIVTYMEIRNLILNYPKKDCVVEVGAITSH